MPLSSFSPYGNGGDGKNWGRLGDGLGYRVKRQMFMLGLGELRQTKGPGVQRRGLLSFGWGLLRVYEAIRFSSTAAGRSPLCFERWVLIESMAVATNDGSSNFAAGP